jgi:hypothetical protein
MTSHEEAEWPSAIFLAAELTTEVLHAITDPQQLPFDNPRADCQLLRDQWEYTHLARFFVQLAAFVFQLTSVLVEITTHSERG